MKHFKISNLFAICTKTPVAFINFFISWPIYLKHNENLISEECKTITLQQSALLSNSQTETTFVYIDPS